MLTLDGVVSPCSGRSIDSWLLLALRRARRALEGLPQITVPQVSSLADSIPSAASGKQTANVMEEQTHNYTGTNQDMEQRTTKHILCASDMAWDVNSFVLWDITWKAIKKLKTVFLPFVCVCVCEVCVCVCVCACMRACASAAEKINLEQPQVPPLSWSTATSSSQRLTEKQWVYWSSQWLE